MRAKFAITASIVLALAAGCDSGPAELRLVTPESPLDRAIAEDMVGLFGQSSTVRLTLGDAVLAEQQALDAVLNGEADIALVSNNLPFRDEIATVTVTGRSETLAEYQRLMGLDGLQDLFGAEQPLPAVIDVTLAASPDPATDTEALARILGRLGVGGGIG